MLFDHRKKQKFCTRSPGRQKKDEIAQLKIKKNDQRMSCQRILATGT